MYRLVSLQQLQEYPHYSRTCLEIKKDMKKGDSLALYSLITIEQGRASSKDYIILLRNCALIKLYYVGE